MGLKFKRVLRFSGWGLLLGFATVVMGLVVDSGFVYFSRLINYPYKNEILEVDWYQPKKTVRGGGVALRGSLQNQTHKNSKAPNEAAILSLEQKVFSGPAHGMILIKDEITLKNRFTEKLSEAQAFNSMSMSKALLSLLIGILIEEGKIASIEDSIAKYLTEFKSDERSKIKIRNLLEMNSGFKFNKSTTNPLSDQVRIHLGEGLFQKLFEFRTQNPAGEVYSYLNINSLLLVELVRRVTGEDFGEVLSQKIWSKLAVQDASIWVDGVDNFPKFYCCFFATPKDWIEVGHLFLNAGKNRMGTQLVSQGWIQKMVQPSTTEKTYGLHIQVGGPGNFYATGRGHQRLMMIPDGKIIFLRVGETDKNWNDDQIFEILNGI